MANHSPGFVTEGYKAADGSVRVTIRGPGKLWSAPADYTLTSHEVEHLITILRDALVEADESDKPSPEDAEDIDPTPDCRCETCPPGGPYTCISTD